MKKKRNKKNNLEERKEEKNKMGANEIVDLYLEGFKTFQPQTFHFLNILIGKEICFFCQNSGHN